MVRKKTIKKAVKKIVRKPIKKSKIRKIKNPQKIKKAIIDSLDDRFREFKLEAKMPKRRFPDDDDPWSGNIYRYSF